MQSPATHASGSRPAATTRRATSVAVRIPTSSPLSLPSTRAASVRFATISLAALAMLSSSRTQTAGRGPSCSIVLPAACLEAAVTAGRAGAAGAEGAEGAAAAGLAAAIAVVAAFWRATTWRRPPAGSSERETHTPTVGGRSPAGVTVGSTSWLTGRRWSSRQVVFGSPTGAAASASSPQIPRISCGADGGGTNTGAEPQPGPSMRGGESHLAGARAATLGGGAWAWRVRRRAAARRTASRVRVWACSVTTAMATVRAAHTHTRQRPKVPPRRVTRVRDAMRARPAFHPRARLAAAAWRRAIQCAAARPIARLAATCRMAPHCASWLAKLWRRKTFDEPDCHALRGWLSASASSSAMRREVACDGGMAPMMLASTTGTKALRKASCVYRRAKLSFRMRTASIIPAQRSWCAHDSASSVHGFFSALALMQRTYATPPTAPAPAPAEATESWNTAFDPIVSMSSLSCQRNCSPTDDWRSRLPRRIGCCGGGAEASEFPPLVAAAVAAAAEPGRPGRVGDSGLEGAASDGAARDGSVRSAKERCDCSQGCVEDERSSWTSGVRVSEFLRTKPSTSYVTSPA